MILEGPIEQKVYSTGIKIGQGTEGEVFTYDPEGLCVVKKKSINFWSDSSDWMTSPNEVTSLRQIAKITGNYLNDRLLREYFMMHYLMHLDAEISQHIPQPISIYRQSEELFLVMRQVHGKSLTRLMFEKHPLEDMFSYLDAAARFEESLIAESIIHGDPNQGNIMIGDDGIVYRVDYGGSFVIDESNREESISTERRKFWGTIARILTHYSKEDPNPYMIEVPDNCIEMVGLGRKLANNT